MLTEEDLKNWITTNSGENWRIKLADYIVANSKMSSFYEANCLISEVNCQVLTTNKTFKQVYEEKAHCIWQRLKESGYVDEENKGLDEMDLLPFLEQKVIATIKDDSGKSITKQGILKMVEAEIDSFPRYIVGAGNGDNTPLPPI